MGRRDGVRGGEFGGVGLEAEGEGAADGEGEAARARRGGWFEADEGGRAGGGLKVDMVG